MQTQVLIALIGVMGGLLSMFVKSILDRRSLKKDMGKKDEYMRQRLISIEDILTKQDIKILQTSARNASAVPVQKY